MTIREWLLNLPQDIRNQLVSMQNRSAFLGTNGRHLRFKNDYILSIQWGFGNYCDNREVMYDDIFSPPSLDSANAELAYFRAPNGDLEYISESDDTVIGYQTVEQIEAWARKVMAL